MKKTITITLSSAPEWEHPLVGGGTASTPISFEVEVDDTPKPFLLLKKGVLKTYYGEPTHEPCHACKSGPVKYMGSAASGWCQQYQCDACGAKFEVSPYATGSDGTIKWVSEFYVDKK